MWSDLYEFLPGRLLPTGTSMSADKASLQINGNRLFVRQLCQGVIFVLCDIVALWRAYVIYGRPRWLRVGAVTIFILSSVLYLIDGILNCMGSLSNPPAFVADLIQEHWAAFAAIWILPYASTACAQLFSTALISRKAWVHCRKIQNVIAACDNGGSVKTSKQVTVLYIMIESGIIYTSLWIVYVVTSWFGVNDETWGDYWMCQISGMYPTLVIVVVMLRDSILEQSATTASEPLGRANVSIRYAAHDTEAHDVEVDVTACRKFVTLPP
ncbi:hypothetical protein PENSPDRAFT_758741 [Peniophora sp. CONT]|nr:hypothetical protein PENSPDRAFT_758741 [Peniophora sp. CONT]